MRNWSLREVVLKLPLIEVKVGPNERRALEGESAGLRVALRAANGLFVTAQMNRRAELVAAGPKVDRWEIFDVLRFVDNKIALRAVNGMFVAAEINSTCELVANRSTVREWETFSVENSPDGCLALRAFNGLYVSAKLHRGSELVADREECDSWEKFVCLLVT